MKPSLRFRYIKRGITLAGFRIHTLLAALLLCSVVVADEAPFTAHDLSASDRARITSFPAESLLPLKSGERLVYKIGWSFFEVGEAILSLTEEYYEGVPTLKMELVASTNAFADNFYKVRNRTTSWILPDMSQPLAFKAEQSEGSRERETIVRLNPDNHTAQYENIRNHDKREPIAVTESIWDPMSITYYVRSLPLEVGQGFVIPTTNGKELFLTEIEVVKQVEKKFRIGKRDALLLEPNIKDLGGVFRKSKNATVRFWFSNDDQQLPLRMESSVAVGKFWAELDRIEADSEEIQSDL